ncbi:MAG TPA: LON peptidase substrate-binding domain-containing protein, partial [Anaerolineaceae bacterium]|nr:LON peptidase substrate-binding domain-containing protein [Anaerolineaceae bacterium]
MKDNQRTSHPDDTEDYISALHQRTEELYQIPDMAVNEDGTIEAAVLILRDVVVFPHMVSPIFVPPGPNLLAIEDAQESYETMIALIVADPESDEEPTQKDFLPIGVEVAVGRLLSMPDDNNSALIQGRRRLEVLEFTQTEPYFRVRARVIVEPTRV